MAITPKTDSGNSSLSELLYLAQSRNSSHDVETTRAGEKFTSYLRAFESAKIPDKMTTAALTKDQINILQTKMQLEMNAHMFQVLGEDERGDLRIPSFLSSFRPLPVTDPEASENRHTTQNNDAVSHSSGLAQIINEAARTFGVDVKLIQGVIKAESDFQVLSTSPRGACGLMQLMPDTARELGVDNVYDPRENIMGGTKYLKNLLDRYHGDQRLALAAYNWGMGNVERNPSGLPKETRAYIQRVISYIGESEV